MEFFKRKISYYWEGQLSHFYSFYMEYQITSNHNSRKAILASYNLLEPAQDNDYDQITFLAASICKVPVAYISILNTNHLWFKAAYGINLPEKLEIEGSF
ncbi:MAG: hypothetical protein WCD31_10840, partial [Gillisia sp.]